MRIIGGLAKGRQILCPRGLEVRPAQDKIREAIFNILAGVVEGSIVLDLFAGTGALGIEGLSRGARQCVFVEKNTIAVQTIKKNLELTGFADRGIVLKRDAFKCLPELQKKGMRFWLIFIDPPYPLWERPDKREMLFNLVQALGEDTILESHTIVIIRHRTHKVEMPESLGSLRLFDKRSYGDTTLTFWRLHDFEVAEPGD
ncbi:MAG TPA: 16S rRNA (guanine(966)-N(2))-methyltransferase RsmD [Candidatus Hypogeohydataceae bacterium YC40]